MASLQDIAAAIEVLQSVGAIVCRPALLTYSEQHYYDEYDVDASVGTSLDRLLSSCPDVVHTHRILQENEQLGNDDDIASATGWIINGVGAILCVTVAALAAGLTLGMLGLDPLMLLIKQRAGPGDEQRMATKLLPIVQQRHLLLVTLLLMNSMANEALPIFLEALVPPAVSILLSVTLVLFFGEIIPSAIFTGPNQTAIATRLIPLVRAAMLVLYPIAAPIAKLLDIWLHDDDDRDAFNRGEFSALIRIQYESRMAEKQKRKQQRALMGTAALAAHAHEGDGALDFLSQRGSVRNDLQQLINLPDGFDTNRDAAALSRRPTMDESDAGTTVTAARRNSYHNDDTATNASDDPSAFYERHDYQRTDSIHGDEVIMVEGALQMKTKLAMDILTPMRKVVCVPHDMILNEHNLVHIYASGFSRIPVYQRNPDEPADKSRLLGVLITRQLIVVQPRDERRVDTLPIHKPVCISNAIRLVDLLNLFQTGGTALKGGHMCLVCARPKAGNRALAQNQPLPDTVGLMGLVTLEDVLETLLQEQIYDEMDRLERDEARLGRMVIRKWKRFIKRGGKAQYDRNDNDQSNNDPALLPVVEQAMRGHGQGNVLGHGNSKDEQTALLSQDDDNANSGRHKGSCVVQ